MNRPFDYEVDAPELARQHREHAVLCSTCLRRHTWSLSGRCDDCEGPIIPITDGWQHPAGSNRPT